MKKIYISIGIAFLLWVFMFLPIFANIIPFWYALLGSTFILFLLSFRHIKWTKTTLNDVIFGVVSAAVLWGIFWIGHYLSTRWFDFAAEGVQNVYAIKDGFNPMFLALILLFWSGPFEEIFWRGFLQEKLSENFGKNAGFIIATLLYASVHIVSLNFMLIMAALTCGAFWGLIYRLKKNSLWALMISHALWGCAVFLWFPIS
jgi:membrane protease YdiL (CAAX protease family)